MHRWGFSVKRGPWCRRGQGRWSCLFEPYSCCLSYGPEGNLEHVLQCGPRVRDCGFGRCESGAFRTKDFPFFAHPSVFLQDIKSIASGLLIRGEFFDPKASLRGGRGAAGILPPPPLYNPPLYTTPPPPQIRNEKSAQRGSSGPDIPAHVRPKTSVMPSKSWKTSILARTSRADVHDKTSV